MLILSRKLHETIHIGEHIAITVVRIGPETVRLGIDASKEINIVRGELRGPAEVSDKPPCRGVNHDERND